jgi:hypothetical protein
MSTTRQLEEAHEVSTVVERSSPPKNGLAVQPGTVLVECPTSLDLTTSKGKAWAINAMGESDAFFDPDKPAEFTATDWLLMPGEATDEETGEVKQFTWLVLFDAEGKTAKTTSEVIPHRVYQMLSLYSVTEWHAGIKVRLLVRRSRKSGRTYHDLRIVPE